MLHCIVIVVASAPRGLQLSLSNDDPPVVSVTWQRPRRTHGDLNGYRLRYTIEGDSSVEERRFEGEKYHFTSGFLGQCRSFCDGEKTLVFERTTLYM